MTLPYAIMAFVTLQRLSELVIARRNTARLLADGAYEVGASHYPVMSRCTPPGSRLYG